MFWLLDTKDPAVWPLWATQELLYSYHGYFNHKQQGHRMFLLVFESHKRDLML